jgi:hypothetical protein
MNIFTRCHNKQSGDYSFVTQEELNQCQDNIERQLAGKIPNFAFFFFLFFSPKLHLGVCWFYFAMHILYLRMRFACLMFAAF